MNTATSDHEPDSVSMTESGTTPESIPTPIAEAEEIASAAPSSAAALTLEKATEHEQREPDHSAPASVSAPATVTRNAASGWALLLALAALLAGAYAAWQAHVMRNEAAALRAEVAQRISVGDAATNETRALALRHQENITALQGKITALEAKADAVKGQTNALEDLYRKFSRFQDDRVLVEVEQAVMIAAQQLQLAGNIESALIALRGAQAQLDVQDRGQFATLRRALASDIERLNEQSPLDIPGTALKLEHLLEQLDTLPLAPDDVPPSTSPTVEEEYSADWRGFAKSLARDIWNEALSLVRIERLDSAVELLTPEQATFLRENLKIRLLTARLALLARDGRTYATDLAQARGWLEKFFNTRDETVKAAIDSLRELETLPVRIEHQTLTNSFNELRLLQSRDSAPTVQP
jgi:uroporphyrin-3 C-methyltransferase